MATVSIKMEVDAATGQATLKSFTGQMADVGTQAKKAKSATTEAFDSIGKSMAIAGGFAIAAGGAFVLAAKQVVDYGGALIDASAKTGLTVEAIQELTFAGGLVGVTFDEISAGIAKMQAALVNAPEKFDRLGLSAAALRQLNPEEQFTAIAEQISKIEDPAARSAAAIEIFGKAGVTLLPLLTSNVAEAREEAERLGLVMTGEVAAAADDLGDSVDTLIAVFGGLMRSMGAAIVTSQPLHTLIEGLIEIVGELSGSLNDSQSVMRSWVDAGVLLIVNALGVLVKVVAGVIDVWSGMKIALMVVGGAMEKVAIQAQTFWMMLKDPFNARKAYDEMGVAINALGERVKASIKEEIQSNAARQDSVAKVGNAIEKLAVNVENSIGQSVKSSAAARDSGQAFEFQGKGIDKATKAVLGWRDAAGNLAQGEMVKLIKATEEGAEMLRKFEAELLKINSETMPATAAATELASDKMKAFADGVIKAADDVRKAEEAASRFRAEMAQLGQILLNVGGILGGAFGNALQNIGAGMEAGAAAAEQYAKATGDMGRALAVTNVAATAYRSGILGGAAAGAAFGASVGKSIPIIGSFVGALGGGLIGGLLGWIGGAKKAAEETRKLREEWIRSQGGLQALTEKAKQAGVSLDKVFSAKTPKQFEAAVNEATAALDAFQAAMDETAAAQDAVREAAEKYGLTIEEMGPAWAAQELNKKAEELWRDYQLLIGAGADQVAVLEKMAPAFSEYVNAAIASGVAIPESFRKIIEALIEQGLLLDANGNAYESVEAAGITFTDSLEEGLGKVIASVNKLIEALYRINGINPEVTVTVNTEYPNGPPPTGEGGYDKGGGGSDQPAGFAEGGWLPANPPYGRTFVAGEREDELIIPKSKLGSIGNRTNNFYISGAMDPRAVAAAVQRILYDDMNGVGADIGRA